MTHAAQQTSFIPAIAEQPLAWSSLIVPTQQSSLLHSGGGDYLPDFISPSEEAALLRAVDAAPWRTDLQRRVQHYGYRYDYAERGIVAGDRLGALPQWAGEICDRLQRQHLFPAPPEQLIVNEYEPGQGIAPHTDRDCFGPVVASLSLGSDCMMRILPHREDARGAFDLVLRRRSLVVFRDESREVWRHGIAPRKSDRQAGRRIPRQRRVSLTFRTVA